MIRLIGYFFGIGTALALLAAAGVGIFIGNLAEDLPDYEVLAKYEPPVTTRVHASDGALMGEFARERRLYLPIQAVPDRVKAAFLSAEDKNFYKHPGVDVTGLFRAVVTNFQNAGSGRRQVGASTITQQVAKNFLLSSDQTYERKIKEMILAFRIEQAYSKDRILELYVNEIFFGLGAYGVAGAALTYFDKSVNELTVAEAAYLAALPKGPTNYHPFKYTDRAIERRNWVIDQMVENGYVSREEGDKSKAEPLGVKPRRNGTYLFAGEYFTEEVRREIISRYGEDALYEGGLSVRTTLDPKMQLIARKAMQNGLLKYDTLRGYRGPLKTIDLGADWGVPLAGVKSLDDVPEWRLAVVLESTDEGLSIGLQPKREISGQLSARAGNRHHRQGRHELRDAPRRQRQAPQGGFADRSAQARRRDLRREEGRQRLHAAPAAGGFRRAGGDGSAYGARAGDGRRLLLRAVGVQSRHAGDAPAGFVVQAGGIRRRARQRLYARIGHHGRADNHHVGRHRLVAEELRRQGRRPLDAAHGHRALAQSDDRAAGQRHGHEDRRGICRALRRLRSSGAISADGAGVGRNHRDAHGFGLLGDGQRRTPDQAVADRSYPGPLRQDRVQA